MSKPAPDLQLEHPTTDEHTDVLLQVAALRARGKEALADQIERAYRLSFDGRGAFGPRPLPPTSRPRPQRRKRR